MIQILVEEMCNISLQGWKARECHLLIFKIVNAKNLKMELRNLLKYVITNQWDFS